MIRTLHTAIILTLLTITSLHAAPVALRWDAETSRPAPMNADIYRGETVLLQPRLLSYGQPIDLTTATLTLYWQTNGMETAWWQTPANLHPTTGTISAVWLPGYDVGAPLYTFFLGATTPAGTAYRAHGTLRLRHSPGWSPSALPPPPNAWVTPGELQTLSNVLANAIQEGGGGTGDADAVRTELLQTNLQTRAQITAATNHIIKTYFDDPDSWLTISNKTLKIHHGSKVLWSSEEGGGAFDPSATSLLWSAISTINSTLGHKADKAWGNYLPDGSHNPEPTWATMLNAPVTLFGSGVQWTTAGTYALLTTPGAAAVVASPAGGELRIGPDVTTNFFGYRTGGSYLVGARTNGIQVFDDGTPEGYAELTYDSFGDGTPPTIWFTPSLALDWSPIEPVWIDNGETATAIVPATTKTGFWRATTSLTIDAILFSTMPVLLEGGIFGNPHTGPVKYDSTITINVGGKSYRIPAEEVN